jgi:hypothetical protein
MYDINQLFFQNMIQHPTHNLFILRLTCKADNGKVPKALGGTEADGIIFRARSYSAGAYICELYVPKNCPGNSNQAWLGIALGLRLQQQLGEKYSIQIVGTESYKHLHSDSTDEETCFPHID